MSHQILYSNPKSSFAQSLVSKFKDKVLTINGVERCSYFEDYETNWDGTSTGIPIYCNGELIELKDGNKICKKCYNRRLVFCSMLTGDFGFIQELI